ncbi:hypothetical protein L6164_013392 [Bauhinia variegata]|uniref:Uncharacterized protein n=1 Tax=Bauhinia variegata TaxID=167791 RepID=A0ACB9NE21_BAUVA|nr:hypothetical protein L6164_013392 [Bauhinia variegata]
MKYRRKFTKTCSSSSCSLHYYLSIAFRLSIKASKLLQKMMEPDMATPYFVNPTNVAVIKAKQENGSYREEQAVEKNIEAGEKKNPGGGLKIASLLLVNQALATLAFFGVGVNMVLFLTRVLDQDTAHAANSISKWTGTVYLFSLIGAFLSDSYWGRYITCTVFQLIFVLGLGLLSLSSWLFLIKPAGCGIEIAPCMPTSSLGISIFYLSIYLVAFGYGGHQPTLATFGADQYDEKNQKERTSKEAFFCYFYFALNLGSLFSNTILVYYEDKGMWTMGFLVSLASAIVALVSYLAGTPWYRHVKPSGNPVVRVTQVFVAASRKWKVVRSSDDQLYEVEGAESAIKGSRKIRHSNELGCLDKAATITENDVLGSKNPWRLCTITQVEEANMLVNMVMEITARGGSPGWIPNNLNSGHMDRFFFLIAVLTAVDFCFYLLCAKWYKSINNVEDMEMESTEDDQIINRV